MSGLWLFCNALIALLIVFIAPHLSKSAEVYKPPLFIFSWLDNKLNFTAGEIANIKVIVYDNFDTTTYKHPFNPTISIVNSRGQDEKFGNSTYITGVCSDLGTDTNKWQLHFIPIIVGMFHVFITQQNLRIGDYSKHYFVTPGPIYLPGGIVSWMDEVDTFVAGTKATVLILPKDAFGNNVTIESEGQKVYNFVVYATHEPGSDASVLDVSYKGWNEFGYLSIDFITVTSGNLLLHIKDKNTPLIGSPLPFTVYPGELDVGNCMAEWKTNTTNFQLFSTMETSIIQRDKFGNIVPGLYDFDLDVIEKGTNLVLPIGDLQFVEVSPGVQSFSFELLEPGNFSLMITDNKKKPILNMPFEFSVFIGYCDGLKSIVNGSGLQNSIAGEVSKFSIFLRDAYQYPSQLDLHRLRVQITLPSLSIHVNPQIRSLDSLDGSQPTGMLDFDPTGISSVPFVNLNNNISAGFWKIWNTAFEVSYVPEKAGEYEIHIFCGNVPFNHGIPFKKSVTAGKANTTASRVVKFEPKVSSLVVHGVELQLRDSFSNPILTREKDLSKFVLETDVLHTSIFKVFLFVANDNGTYTGFYMAMAEGDYDMCSFYNGGRINPCPFRVDVYERNSFPTAYEDTVSVWEDESVGFNAIANDNCTDGKARIAEYQKPDHGSILVYGDWFRYTPYKGFYGNDSFTYTIADAREKYASSIVYVQVLLIPPQFASFPPELHAVEDIISPQFGGFSGFVITYSDSKENISIMFTAKHGSVFLSPLSMQLWDPMWNELSVSKMEGGAKELYLTARLEVINFSLKSLKYIGEGNFSGDDVIRVSTINRNGKRDLDVPIIVNPINDPPFINVPEFIMLGNVTEDEGFLIFDSQRDNFTFSIGDPDLLHFPGNKSHFRVMFSVEVSSGFFSAKLPAELISTTELKLKNSKQWQPLQTFVEISKQITVKAKALRFLGTIDQCNNVLQQILYYGDEDGGVIRLSVNDMGWFGFYPDCEEMMSAPLITEATINLITKMPVNSVVAHSLGSVIVIESIVVSSLAVILMFFTCKCVMVLLHKKKKNQAQYHNKVKSSHENKVASGILIGVSIDSQISSDQELIDFGGYQGCPTSEMALVNGINIKLKVILC
ncbi:hypothetical protein L1887_27025 [Cichorium endivia]|nr:hypothetical protein L1887_27025 [Cichorium endivia]